MARVPPPQLVRLEASTACQLRCPMCPTATGEVGKGIGTGFLKFDNFKKFIDNHPTVCDIELSNYGEIFLNNEISQIIEYAYEQGVHLYCENGANLNDVRDDVLEALVRFRFRYINCSIDGATDEVYSIYRKRGNLNTVLSNVRKINEWKKKYRSRYPVLQWQFVIFGHNEHEIIPARQLAEEHDMNFFPKLSWGDMFTEDLFPIKDTHYVKQAAQLPVATRQEFKEKFGQEYNQRTICGQLWQTPQINFDGKMLGCCMNYWGDFGDVFEDGLDSVLNGDKMNYARAMLMGVTEPRDDIPCTTCKHYIQFKSEGKWLSPPALPVVSRRREHLSLAYKRLVPASTKRCIRRAIHLFHEKPSSRG